jgi:L,D-transpeptidase catalytic domain
LSSRGGLLAGSGAAGALLAVSVLLLDAGRAPGGAAPVQAPLLPDPPRPAFTVPTGLPLSRAGTESRWAPVLQPVAARASPDDRAPVVARLATTTPEGTSNLVLVVGRRVDEDGLLWLRARLPVLPNGTTGWLPRSALGGYGVVHTRLIVDLERLNATLLRDGRRVFSAPVGVGTPEFPTPRGEFYVRNELTSRSPSYVPLAFGTSARSSVLTDWPGGGFIGIHGTDRPDLLPGRVSHGCIRLENEDILRLGRLMPVGTPVTVR